MQCTVNDVQGGRRMASSRRAATSYVLFRSSIYISVIFSDFEQVYGTMCPIDSIYNWEILRHLNNIYN